MLLAILKRRKKITFSGCPLNKCRRPRLRFPIMNEGSKENTEGPKVQKVPKAKEVQPNLSQKPTAVVTSNATYTQPNDHPKSLPDLVTESVDGADHPCEEADEEMPPLEDAEA